MYLFEHEFNAACCELLLKWSLSAQKFNAFPFFIQSMRYFPVQMKHSLICTMNTYEPIFRKIHFRFLSNKTTENFFIDYHHTHIYIQTNRINFPFSTRTPLTVDVCISNELFFFVHLLKCYSNWFIVYTFIILCNQEFPHHHLPIHQL